MAAITIWFGIITGICVGIVVAVSASVCVFECVACRQRRRLRKDKERTAAEIDKQNNTSLKILEEKPCSWRERTGGGLIGCIWGKIYRSEEIFGRARDQSDDIESGVSKQSWRERTRGGLVEAIGITRKVKEREGNGKKEIEQKDGNGQDGKDEEEKKEDIDGEEGKDENNEKKKNDENNELDEKDKKDKKEVSRQERENEEQEEKENVIRGPSTA